MTLWVCSQCVQQNRDDTRYQHDSCRLPKYVAACSKRPEGLPELLLGCSTVPHEQLQLSCFETVCCKKGCTGPCRLGASAYKALMLICELLQTPCTHSLSLRGIWLRPTTVWNSCTCCSARENSSTACENGCAASTRSKRLQSI